MPVRNVRMSWDAASGADIRRERYPHPATIIGTDLRDQGASYGTYVSIRDRRRQRTLGGDIIAGHPSQGADQGFGPDYPRRVRLDSFYLELGELLSNEPPVFGADLYMITATAGAGSVSSLPEGAAGAIEATDPDGDPLDVLHPERSHRLDDRLAVRRDHVQPGRDRHLGELPVARWRGSHDRGARRPDIPSPLGSNDGTLTATTQVRVDLVFGPANEPPEVAAGSANRIIEVTQGSLGTNAGSLDAHFSDDGGVENLIYAVHTQPPALRRARAPCVSMGSLRRAPIQFPPPGTVPLGYYPFRIHGDRRGRR